MKISSMYRPLQAGVLASAMLWALSASAQMPNPEMPAPAAAPSAQQMPAAQQMQKHRMRAGHRANAPRHHRANGVEPAKANRLATDMGKTSTDYERNALARCDAFKAREDHRACVERMQQPAQGSVMGGGVLREYSYEVPANGS